MGSACSASKSKAYGSSSSHCNTEECVAFKQIDELAIRSVDGSVTSEPNALTTAIRHTRLVIVGRFRDDINDKIDQFSFDDSRFLASEEVQRSNAKIRRWLDSINASPTTEESATVKPVDIVSEPSLIAVCRTSQVSSKTRRTAETSSSPASWLSLTLPEGQQTTSDGSDGVRLAPSRLTSEMLSRHIAIEELAESCRVSRIPLDLALQNLDDWEFAEIV